MGLVGVRVEPPVTPLESRDNTNDSVFVKSSPSVFCSEKVNTGIGRFESSGDLNSFSTTNFVSFSSNISIFEKFVSNRVDVSHENMADISRNTVVFPHPFGP